MIGRKRWNRILRKFAVSVLWIWNTAPGLGAEPSALKFAGVPFTAGSTVQANAPLSAEEKTYAAQGGNPVPPAAVAVIATPAGFDPKRSWPVLVICSTSDFKRQNRNDLVQFYRRVGLAEGWVLLAGDGPQLARNDTAGWRSAMTLHYIDNLDARLEMFAAGYLTAKPIAERIFDRVRPLPGNLVKSLEKFQQPSDAA